MMYDKLNNKKNLDKKSLTTSEVIKDSFTNVFNELENEEFVIVENHRKKKTLVVMDIENIGNIHVVKRPHDGVKIPVNVSLIKSIARSHIKENAYYLMKFESKNITFPEVEYYDQLAESNKNKFEIIVTKNLIKGWQYIINEQYISFFDGLKTINSIVAKDQAMDAGELRTGNVSISNTEYVPPIPKKKLILSMFHESTSNEDIDKGMATLLVKLIKAQPFYDGNKRSSFLIINRLLMDFADKLLIVKDKDFLEFSKLLNNYYDNEDTLEEIVSFLTTKCIYNTYDRQIKQ